MAGCSAICLRHSEHNFGSFRKSKCDTRGDNLRQIFVARSHCAIFSARDCDLHFAYYRLHIRVGDVVPEA